MNSGTEWLSIFRGNTKEELTYFAKLAIKAERFDEVIAVIKSFATTGQAELDTDTMNLLSIAYKNKVGALRYSWRALSSVEVYADENLHKKKAAMATRYRQQIEFETYRVTMEVLTLLSDHLIPSASSEETKIFYHKMQGDYFRYLAEVATGEQRKSSVEGSALAYRTALESAEDVLPTTHPVRLGIVLNLAIFYYEIQGEPEKACNFVKTAMEAAMADIGLLGEESFRDTALIIQLLRDNLGLWTADQALGESEDQTLI